MRAEEQKLKEEKEVRIGNTPILWVATVTQDSDTGRHESKTVEEEKGGKKLRMDRKKCLMFNCLFLIVLFIFDSFLRFFAFLSG